MKKLPLELKRAIWSNITGDEDLRSCALVNWEWYCQYFAREAIGVPIWHNQYFWKDSLDQQFGHTPFQSDAVLEPGEKGNIHDSVTILLNKFETCKTEWYNRVYTPYIIEVNLEYLKVDVKELHLKFTALTTIVGDAKQLLSLFATSDVIQHGQLKNLSIKLTSQSVLDKVVDQLFDKLGETQFNIDRLKIEMREDSGPKISLAKTASIVRFLGQLTRLDVRRAYFEPDIFRYLSNLEILCMEGRIITCEDWCQRAIQLTDTLFKYLGKRLVQLTIDGQDQQSYFKYSKYSEYLKYLSNLQNRSVKHAYGNPLDIFGALDYLGEICDNINRYAKKLEFLAFSNHHVDLFHNDVAIEGLTQRGCGLRKTKCYSPEFLPYLSGRYDYEINVFALSSDGGAVFRLKELRMRTDDRFIHNDIDDVSTLTELGLAFRQLERINFEIEVDFSKVSAPSGTVLFPNLVRCDGRLISTNRSRCICHFVKAHMPQAKFYEFGLFCLHCYGRNRPDVNAAVEMDDDAFPRWQPSDKGCPNVETIQVEDPPCIFFDECV